jgi:hypothetical protein
MVNFGFALRTFSTPEWRSQYIDYIALRTIVERMQELKSHHSTDMAHERHLFREEMILNVDKINTFVKKMELKYIERQKELQIQLEIFRVKGTNKKKLKMLSVFQEHYRALILVDKYVQLNHTGFVKILKKYDKNAAEGTPKLKESYVHYIEREYFYHSKVIKFLITKTENNVIEKLFEGNRHIGMERLRVERDESHREQFIFTSGLLSGIAMALTVITIFYYFHDYRLISVPYSDTSLFLYKVAFYPIFMLILFFGDILIWSAYSINYVFIFELNPRKRLSKYEVLDLGMICYNVWIFSLLMYLLFSCLDAKGEIDIGGYAWIIPLIMYLFYISWLLFPLRLFYRSARFWLIGTISRIACAPLVHVKFRDFFIGDQLTSLVEFLSETQLLICIYPMTLNPNSALFCTGYTSLALPILSIWPHLARFLQCLRRYRDSQKFHPHLVNAGKYFSSIAALMFAYLDAKILANGQPYATSWNYFRVLWIVANFISTVYKLGWDMYMDFGLLRFGKGIKYPGLRREIIFHPFWYYVAMVQNFLLRFTWVPMIFINNYLGSQISVSKSGFWVDLLSGSLEIFRRCVWNIFRLENEHLNNVEEYRATIDLPLPFEKSQSKKEKNFLYKMETKLLGLIFPHLTSSSQQDEGNELDVVFQEVLEAPQKTRTVRKSVRQSRIDLGAIEDEISVPRSLHRGSLPNLHITAPRSRRESRIADF